MIQETINVNKGGIDILSLSLSRSGKGLVVRAKAHVSIEEFFHTLARGHAEPIYLHGRWWRPVSKEGSLPLIYQFSQPMPGCSYSLTAVGQDLLQSNESAPAPPSSSDFDEDFGDEEENAPVLAGPRGGNRLTPNISFLRFKGISEGDGVEFAIPTVQTAEALRSTSKLLMGATKRFYLDYLKPLDVVITMTAQEVR